METNDRIDPAVVLLARDALLLIRRKLPILLDSCFFRLTGFRRGVLGGEDVGVAVDWTASSVTAESTEEPQSLSVVRNSL